jgi:hypothetical protein
MSLAVDAMQAASDFMEQVRLADRPDGFGVRDRQVPVCRKCKRRDHVKRIPPAPKSKLRRVHYKCEKCGTTFKKNDDGWGNEIISSPQYYATTKAGKATLLKHRVKARMPLYNAATALAGMLPALHNDAERIQLRATGDDLADGFKGWVWAGYDLVYRVNTLANEAAINQWRDEFFRANGWRDKLSRLADDPKTIRQSNSGAKAEPTLNGEQTGENPGVEDLVNLDEAAAIVHRVKRTLEGYQQDKTKNMPMPYVQGGGGKPSLWKWNELRPWLEKTFVPDLPKRFPRNVR